MQLTMARECSSVGTTDAQRWLCCLTYNAALCRCLQVVSEPAYSDIMKALLFTSDGMELYLRNPASFNIPTGTSTPDACC